MPVHEPSPTFKAHCEAYIQTKVALDPVHLHPQFKFVGSLPDGAYPIDNRERYMKYREDGLRVSWPDWINNPTLVVYSRVGTKEVAMAKVDWSGTHTGAGGFFPGKEPTGRRVSYSGIVVFEQDTARQEEDGIDGLHLATAYGDLTRFKKQMAGELIVDDEEWERVRKPVADLV